MIRSILGSKWSIDFSEIRLPDEGDALTVGKDRKREDLSLVAPATHSRRTVLWLNGWLSV
jgi:hypothetical protein